MSSEAEPWIGLVEAVPGDPRPSDVDEEIGGAFAHFVCVTLDARGFRAAAATYFQSEGWRVVAVEDVEPVRQRLMSHQPAPDVMKAIDRVRRTGHPDTADEWDVFPVEDD